MVRGSGQGEGLGHLPLANGVVVDVVRGGDLERTRAEVHLHVVVGDDGDLAAEYRHEHLLAHEVLVPGEALRVMRVRVRVGVSGSG